MDTKKEPTCDLPRGFNSYVVFSCQEDPIIFMYVFFVKSSTNKTKYHEYHHRWETCFPDLHFNYD